MSKDKTYKHRLIRMLRNNANEFYKNTCDYTEKKTRRKAMKILEEFATLQGLNRNDWRMYEGRFFYSSKEPNEINRFDIETNVILDFEDILTDLELKAKKHKIFEYYDYKLENENKNYLLNYEEFLKWKS